MLIDTVASTRRRRRSPSSGGGVPFDRSSLILEFYPSQDDARLRATSGQAFTKTGAPTLLTNGYSFADSDGLLFDKSVLNSIISASVSPTGFSVFIVLGTPFGGVRLTSAGGIAKSILTQNDGTLFPVNIYAFDHTTIPDLFIAGDIGYDAGDFEGSANLGNPPNFTSGRHVWSYIYDRTHVPAPAVAWSGTPGEQHSGNANEAGRLLWYRDGLLMQGDGYAPPVPSANVIAGILDPTTSGNLRVGFSPVMGNAFPRIGSILIYAAKLPAADQLRVATWLLANKPLASLTMGPGDLIAPFTLSNATTPYTTPVTKLVENADVAQVHGSSSPIIVITDGQQMTRTVYVRANPRFRGAVYVSTGISGANRAGMTFNLSTQAIANLTAGAGTVSATSITAMGEDWFKLTWTGAQNGGDLTSRTILRLADDAGNLTYNGDGTSAMQYI